MLAADPDWTPRVEGHTDSDGGAAYNLNLSLHRANSVLGRVALYCQVEHVRH